MGQVVASAAARASASSAQDLDQDLVLHVEVEHHVDAQVVSEHLCLVEGPGHSVQDECFVAMEICLSRVANDLYC